MSAYVMDKEDFDKLVLSALTAYHARPGESRLSWWRVDEDGHYAGWREIDRNAEHREDDDYKAFYTPSAVGQMLVSENVASVSYRYSEPGRTTYYGPDIAATMEDDTIETLPGPTDRYYMAPYIYSEPRWEATPGRVFELIDRLDYQSCEHAGWTTSEAYSFLRSLRQAWCKRVTENETV